ncbi:calcium-binding protein CML14 [Perkinsela sp. CCAP 1560/4]|nr:calcium-binding protein CML14 [Perkinsela sp. CCAP 1560/4]|eukprot:KNH06416.1 calcium-binding protein CML14 [Perkinsela sp. CCAP 1560/4]
MREDRALSRKAHEIFTLMMTSDEHGNHFLGTSFLLPALQQLGLNPTFEDVTESLELSDIKDGRICLNDFQTFVLQLRHTKFSRQLLDTCFEAVMSGYQQKDVLAFDEFVSHFQKSQEGLTDEELNYVGTKNTNGKDEIQIREFIDFLSGGRSLQLHGRSQKAVTRSASKPGTSGKAFPTPRDTSQRQELPANPVSRPVAATKISPVARNVPERQEAHVNSFSKNGNSDKASPAARDAFKRGEIHMSSSDTSEDEFGDTRELEVRDTRLTVSDSETEDDVNTDESEDYPEVVEFVRCCC